jgi:hypothetical protein
MPTRESPVARAQQHVARAEDRVARQKQLIERLVRDDHPVTASQARVVLAVLEESLRLAHEHLALEIKHYGNPQKEA